jgi:hypothetical protein
VALDRFLTEDVVRRTRCLLHLGRLAIELGDDDEADVSFLGAASLAARAVAAKTPLSNFEVAALAGYAALALHEHDDAIRKIRAELAVAPDTWWTRADAAELRLVLGANLLAAGQPAEARVSLEASVADYVDLAGNAREFGPSLARARRALAEALLALETHSSDASIHLEAAGDFYRGAGPSFARQLERTVRLAAGAQAPGGPTK